MGPGKETAAAFVALTAVTFAITRLPSPAAEYVPVMVGGLFLLVAVRLAQRQPGGLRRHGIDLGGLLEPAAADDETGWARDLWNALGAAVPAGLREAGVALGVALLIFPPFAVAFHFWYGPEQPFVWNPRAEWASFLLAELLVVGLPEEALFRGYFQTRLTDLWPRKTRVVGARLSVQAVLAQSALFAVAHFAVDFQPQRLAVFFPGLLFGWMRAQRGGIGAAIVMHALSNLYADMLIRGWLLGAG